MKYMLVYRPNAGDVFAVSRLACSPERRVTTLIFSGSWDHARSFAVAMLDEGNSVATAHSDERGYVAHRYWKWGAGSPDRLAVESRKRDRGDVPDQHRHEVEARTTDNPLDDGVVIKGECRVHPRDYRSYLASPRWREKRSIAIRRAGRRCQVCNARTGLDVHHRTYDRLGDEGPGDIIVLCRACHKLFHDNGRLAN